MSPAVIQAIHALKGPQHRGVAAIDLRSSKNWAKKTGVFLCEQKRKIYVGFIIAPFLRAHCVMVTQAFWFPYNFQKASWIQHRRVFHCTFCHLVFDKSEMTCCSFRKDKHPQAQTRKLKKYKNTGLQRSQIYTPPVCSVHISALHIYRTSFSVEKRCNSPLL